MYQPLKEPRDSKMAPLGSDVTLICCMECCFILMSAQPFPWEVHRKIFGLIRGNLQMFVNTHAATETNEDLPFKHSDVECLLQVGFLGNHDHWARELNVFGVRPVCMSLRFWVFFAHTHPLHLWAASHNEPTVNQWLRVAVCVLQPPVNHWQFQF